MKIVTSTYSRLKSTIPHWTHVQLNNNLLVQGDINKKLSKKKKKSVSLEFCAIPVVHYIRPTELMAMIISNQFFKPTLEQVCIQEPSWTLFLRAIAGSASSAASCCVGSITGYGE